MASSSHPLFALLGPLRYACARDFLNLSSIKELRPALAGALARAGSGVKPSTTAALTAQLTRIDDRELSVRKNALQQVLLALRDEGLPIDFLPKAAGEADAPRPVLVLTESGRLPAPEPVKKRRPKASAQTAAKAGKAAPAPPRQKLRPEGAEPKEEDSPARMLSIAPASGPLATALSEVGWRLNPRLVGLLNKKGVRKVK
ncbi:MAG: recG [Myxococcaceae bacterium]|nr:recG [Myxococcaceae bacterium]